MQAQAWQIVGRFGLDALSWDAQAVREPGPGEVRLKVRAVSLNYRDLLMVRGHYNPRQPLPLVPGSDCVGEVEAVGEGVDSALLGTRMCVAFNPGWRDGVLPPEALRASLGGPARGVFSEQVIAPAAALVAPPEHWTDAECATLPCAGVTAWRALAVAGRTRPGDTVLTLGTGGVSLYALQIGKILGAKVCVTSSSSEKLTRASALGADHGICYTDDPKWGKTAAKWSGGGVHTVVELGGAGTLSQSLRAVRPGGTVALIGVLAGVKAEVALTSVLMRHIRVQGIFVGSVQDLSDLCDAMRAAPQVRPVVDRCFALSELPEALRWMAAGRHFGKVVLEA